jgi:NTP pyrophosphatase (non-canonical NTP hydrolase)
MKITKINFIGRVESHVNAETLLHNPGDAILVERGRPRLFVILCPCGCGDEIVVNLDLRSGPAWLLYQNRKGLTLYPSIWREGGCKSHFIIWNERIYWCRYDTLFDGDLEDTAIDECVYEVVKKYGKKHYQEIAELIGEIPWNVLLACRRLVENNMLSEDKDKGIFKLSKNV